MQVAINAQLVSFGETYRNAGVSRYTYQLLQGLSTLAGDQSYTAFVNQREAQDAQKDPLAATGRVRVVPARWPAHNPPQRIAWEQLALPGELRRMRADVFHSPVNVLPGRVPCASVVTIHDLAFLRYPEYFRPTRRYYQRWFTRGSVRRATLVVAVSESTKRDLVHFLRAPEDRILVIYPGIAQDFQPRHDPGTIAAFRARHGLPERYMLYMGTLEPRKNLLTLIEAYARLRGQDEDVPPLVLAGAKGWYYQPLFERVRALGLERAVTFPGYVNRDEQPLWYAGADVFVYPSWYEGFGMPVAEALACGTPAVTSNVSSLPEAAGDAGQQVDPSDPDALAHTLLGVLKDTALRQRLAARGPEWASRFSQARMAREYAECYARAAGMGREAAGRRKG